MKNEEHRSTARVLDILKLLSSGEKDGYTLTEIADKIGAPKSSIFPIIKTLHNRKFISTDKTKTLYFIGISSFAVGSAFLGSNSLYDHIKSVMTEVVDSTLETCQMGILDDSQVLYIAKVDSKETVRLISHIGKKLPIYCTAIGKALVLDKNKDEIEQIIGASEDFPRLTEKTICNSQQLYSQVLQFNESQITQEIEESAMGLMCYAVPIRKAGNIVTSISVSLPVFRFSEQKVENIKQSLFLARQDIEKLLYDQEVSLELLFAERM